MKKVLIAADHYLVQLNLEKIFDQHFAGFAVSFVQDGAAVYHQVLAHDYELVLLSMGIPPPESVLLLQMLLQKRPHLKIIVHTKGAGEMYALRHFKAGAKAYLPKNADAAQMAAAIQLVLDGKKYFHKEILAEISSSYFRIEHENPFVKLSNREFEIAAQLVKGFRLPEISQRLNLQKTTVSTYKKRIFEKLQAKNMIDVLTLAKNYAFE